MTRPVPAATARHRPPPPAHPLLGFLLDAADGRFPPADGGVTVLPALPDGLTCSVAFTGHAVIATARPEPAARAHGPDGFGGSLAPGFLTWLAGPDGRIGVTDVTLVASGTRGPSAGRAPLPECHDLDGHPRVRYARSLRRTALRVYGDARGLVTLAEGIAGRRELSIELHDGDSDSPYGRGHGRALLRDALALVAAGEPVFAAVSPGNARSLRAFLAAGFTPLGSEVLITPVTPGPARP